MKRLAAIYPRVWPILFVAGGIISATWGGHLHLNIFGEMVMVNLHTWMWFLMALAHADVFWRRHNHAPPPPEPKGSANAEAAEKGGLGES